MENGSVRDTWKWPTGSLEGCGMPRYLGPLRRRPTNKCSETITTPQRTNTFRSREMSVTWVFVVRWFANHTDAQVIANQSLKREHQSASQCRIPQVCHVALLGCGKLPQGRGGRGEMRSIREEVAGDRYAVLKERKRARERESQPPQERLWHSVIPGELPHEPSVPWLSSPISPSRERNVFLSKAHYSTLSRKQLFHNTPSLKKEKQELCHTHENLSLKVDGNKR